MRSTYKRITVRDIVDLITANKEKYPLGIDTVVVSGDSESNYTNEKHELQMLAGFKHNGDEFPNAVCYKMHEGGFEEWDCE